mmetsp:Transcript_5646/g.9751  ORF Transcript_5646/g.9751 Transcript_5646/m.9751 type:complete len:231 (-) Transcript_5646:1549-2241(-)
MRWYKFSVKVGDALSMHSSESGCILSFSSSRTEAAKKRGSRPSCSQEMSSWGVICKSMVLGISLSLSVMGSKAIPFALASTVWITTPSFGFEKTLTASRSSHRLKSMSSLTRKIQSSSVASRFHLELANMKLDPSSARSMHSFFSTSFIFRSSPQYSASRSSGSSGMPLSVSIRSNSAGGRSSSISGLSAGRSGSSSLQPLSLTWIMMGSAKGLVSGKTDTTPVHGEVGR